MTSYLTSIDTFSLSRTVFEIFDLKVFRVWPWPLTFRGHPRSKIFLPFESPFATSYLTSIDTFSLSRTVFEIFVFKVFRVWCWPLTFRGHLRSNFFPAFESSYMTSYQTYNKMADFDHFKVKVIDRYFSFLQKSLTHQMTSNDVLRVKIGPAVLAAPSSKSVKSLKKRRKKRTNPYMLGICISVPENFSETKFC